MPTRPLTVLRRGLVPLLAATALLPMLAVSPAEAAYSRNGVIVNRYEAAVVWAVNSQRSKHGLSPLVVASGPTDVARRWAMHMAATAHLAHNPNYPSQVRAAGSSWHWVAENVGYAGQTDPSGLVAAYMASPGHRANILNPHARYLGVGVADGILSGRRVAWNTLDFTDAYSTSYGHTREPADAMPYDGGAVTASRVIGSFEGSWDARVRTKRSSTSLAVSNAHYTGPTTADDSAKYLVKAAQLTTTGYADLLIRVPLDLRHARALRVRMSSTNPLAHAVPVGVLVADGTHVVGLGSYSTSAAGRTITISLPSTAKRWVDTVRIRVTGSTLARLGGTLSQRTATVSIAEVAVLV